MPWFSVWDGLKNKTCRYLLQRYLGQFLENPLNLEQLNIELYSGKATVKEVSLKVDALNELFEEQGWSLEVISGHVGQLTVTIPWNSLITSDSCIEIKDFELTLRPIKRISENISMIESMWSSVSSSMQLAEECMRQTEENNSSGFYDTQSNTFVGLEKFAETIDNVLNRIKANFTNTRIKLEYPNAEGTIMLAVLIDVENFNYKNETGADKHFEQYKCYDHDFNINNIDSNTEQMILVPTFAKHNIILNGVKIYTEEYYINGYHPSTKEKIAIPIMSVDEDQHIVLKVKQTEEIIGPKISLDIDLGAISVFISPRQIHLLMKILNSFSEESNKSKLDEHSVHNKENYLRDTASNFNYGKENMSGYMRTTGGNWRKAFEDNEVPVIPIVPDILTKNYRSNMDYYAESFTSSMTSSSTVTKTIRLSRRVTNMGTSSEILNFIAKILSLSIVILHEDIIVEEELSTKIEKQKELLEIAKGYFRNVQNRKTPDGEENLEKGNENFYAKHHHLLFNFTPILINGSEQRNRNILQYTFSLTVTEVDAFEILNGESYRIVEFDRTENCDEGFHKRPEFSLLSTSTISNINPDLSSTKVDITLDRLNVDLDITIYERLGNLLSPCPFTLAENEVYNECSNSLKSTFEVHLKCEELWMKLRIPIADTRPSDDPNRLPLWQKNLRTDFFYFSFHDFCFLHQLNNFIISAEEINMFYCEKSSNSKVHVLLVKKEDKPHNNVVARRPRVSIHLDNNQNTFPESLLTDHQPFSSDRVCRQSDTAHIKRDVAEYETLLLPGETHEIEKFCSSSLKNSEIQIEIVLPSAYLLLESKQLYEIVYNRLIGDFLMWEPRSVRRSANQNTAIGKDPLLMSSLMDSIYVSTTTEDPSHFNQDYEKLFHQPTSNSFVRNHHQSTYGMNESIYLSTTEKQSTFKLPEPSKAKRNAVSLRLVVDEGFLTLFMPVRDNYNHVLPGQLGKFNLKINDLNLFTVSGFKSDENLGYVCLQLKNLESYHCSIVPMDYPLGHPFVNSQIEEFMTSTFYKTPKNLSKGDLSGNSKRELLALVIEIKKKPSQKVKRLKISTGIQMICLRNIPDMSPGSWLSQLIDFFDVIDYPIEGYSPYGVITEMQLHFWDCVIDYRPLNFPYRAVLEIGSFTLSSNIISAIIGCTMRFVLEECIFSIAPQDLTKNDKYPLYKITFLKSNDLVPVLDLGLFDISLRLSDGKSDKQPLTDVRCSIHDVHLRACADSGKALAQLIVHIANDSIGLDNEPQFMDTSTYSDSNSILSTDKCEEAQEEISVEQQQRVKLMMADAVKDTQHISRSSDNKEKANKFEVYFFPDEASSNPSDLNSPKTNDPENPNEMSDIINFESNVMMNSYFFRDVDEAEEPLPQVKTELGTIKTQLKKSDDLDLGDDDFCVIREDEKQYLDSCGIKNVKLSDDPLRIVDNHFTIPTVKPDLLKAPDTFPIPERRYTLCEMSFTWHLYGGKDFPENGLQNPKNEIKKSKAKMSEAYKSGVAFSKSAGDIQFGKKPKEKLTWKNAGGEDRDHSVLVEIQFSKIRLSHESYPVRCSHASRQVLIVGDVEIRDRLQSSEINKFLYHPSTHNSLSKANENLLIIKALHVRPHPQKSLSEECSLRISLLPLRLHIDQETLVFLIEYFSNLGEKSEEDNETTTKKPEPETKALEPVMGLDDVPEAVQNLKARRIVNENLDLLMDQDATSTTSEMNYNIAQTTDSSPTFFREVIFSPEVPICFDYHGRKVEFSGGLVSGLLMGLFQLQCSEIRLTKLTYRRGLLGIEKLFSYMCREWLKDIKRNQLPKILRGVGPTNAFVQFFQGIYDLFWLPIEQYQRDGRLIRGLQMGAQSFSARTALAALEITSRIIQLLQYTAETAFDMVSPGPSVRRLKRRQHGRKKRPHRPKDIREGVTNAFMIVKDGINDSANTLIETAVSEHEQKGYTGAVGAVVRQIPQLVVCPAVLATQATTNILGGVKSSLVPEAKIEAREKWKDDSE